MDIDSNRFVETGEDPRWPLQSPIQIYIREDMPHLAGHTKDISLSGLHIEIGVKLPANAIITVEIYFQREDVFAFIEQTPLKLKGKVIWRKPLADDYEAWDVGLRFLDISEEQKNSILEEVKTLEVI
ncbi:MAG: PilZ domain-containing protein [SAR324 cluster bacterium]|nr:PilZ domain-containing protein [SAR324 cluster bacterium]MBF0353441.1 PilZ domain-containing protein [SAR324 cluster bacterium]